MQIITLDAETFFSDDYTLKKLSTEAYVRDPRFEVHGWGIRLPDGKLGWLDDRQFRAWAATIDWSQTTVLCHHAQFDVLILSHHYGVQPAFIYDTLSMARLLLGNHLSVGLDSLSKHFNLAAKNVPYNLFKGLHWHQLDRFVQQQLAAGCLHDVELTWQLFQILAKDFPKDEFEIVDLTIRMFTEPRLRGNAAVLAEVWQDEEQRKSGRLERLGVTEAQLQSAEQFKQLLEAEGVEVQYKDGKNTPIPCFAKNDPFMQELLEDDNERVRDLAEARLGVKSTLLQTRAETLGFMTTRGALPVYLKYCGAATTRWAGGDKCLVAGSRVLVFDYQKGLTEKRIVDILPDDLVWDGVDFVEHEGVQFNGYREVIEHDGVCGTPDHVVFTAEGQASLADCAKTRTRILDCPKPTNTQVDIAKRNRFSKCFMPVSMRNRKNSTLRRAKNR